MRSLYDKTSHFTQSTGNIIDLSELRRRHAGAQRDSLARQPESDRLAGEKPIFCPVVITVTPEQRRQARRERQAWRLDVCSSLAVILMTAAFLLRMIL